MLKDALSFWNAIEGKVRDTVKAMSGKNLQCERYDVTTAPDGATGKIGVTQPFGTEIFIPFSVACANAQVGDTVLVVWWKSLSNAKAWFMGDKIGEGGGNAPVTSVNGQTGDVALNAEDVGALPEDCVLTAETAFAIPAAGSSVSYAMPGLTDEHELIRWNFSTSPENVPPVKLGWTTHSGYFTVANNGGTTAETVRPVFVKPTAAAITSR